MVHLHFGPLHSLLLTLLPVNSEECVQNNPNVYSNPVARDLGLSKTKIKTFCNNKSLYSNIPLFPVVVVVIGNLTVSNIILIVTVV